MTPRCSLCGAAVPDPFDAVAVAQGFRQVVWEGRGPFWFCPGHGTQEVTRWIAETLVCDRDLARSLQEGLA